MSEWLACPPMRGQHLVNCVASKMTPWGRVTVREALCGCPVERVVRLPNAPKCKRCLKIEAQQKREIADKVQAILRETAHPELPEGEIQFALHVDGAEALAWADIRNNGAVTGIALNPWNEAQAARQREARP
jgi:hypothetical protein